MRNYLIGALVLGGVGAALLAQSSQTETNLFPYDDPEAVAAGEVLYDDYCASCHGANLEGEANWRQPKETGRMPAPPHDATGHTWHHPDAQLFLLTKYGPAELIGQGYESDMPGFDGVLSDEEILQVLAYIKSTWPSDIIARHDAMNAELSRQSN